MAGETVGSAVGITVVAGTSAFASELVDINWTGITREALETTHQGTSVAGANTFGSKTFIPADLTDPGQLELTFHFDGDKLRADPLTELIAETWTVTWPKAAGDSSAPIFAGSGFCTDMSITAGLDNIMILNATIKFSDGITLTAAT